MSNKSLEKIAILLSTLLIMGCSKYYRPSISHDQINPKSYSISKGKISMKKGFDENGNLITVEIDFNNDEIYDIKYIYYKGIVYRRVISEKWIEEENEQ